MNDYLASRISLGFAAGLNNICAICDFLGEPQKKFKSIHVVGTNGKGSTSFYTANILQAHGLKVGHFTSPHLVSVRERFRINGKFIQQHELDFVISRVESAAKSLGIEPSYFETLTAAAFLWFAENKIDIAVLEAGLGGRLDSTKIAEGDIVVLTSVGLDHTEILGDTLEKISAEKLGIAKEGAIVITEAEQVSPPLVTGNYGKVYIHNAELAFKTAKTYLNAINIPFNESLSRDILAGSVWAGRMQILNNEIILDGAHNPQAAEALADCLREKEMPKMPCVFASLSDKDTAGVLRILKPHISLCYCTQTDNPRMRSAQEVLEICRSLEIPAELMSDFQTDKIPKPFMVTGSLSLIGKAILCLRDRYNELSGFRELDEFPNENYGSKPICRNVRI